MYIMNKRGLRGFSSEQLVHETHSPAQGKEKKKLQGENWFFHEVLLFFFLPSQSCDSIAALSEHLYQFKGYPSCSTSKSHLIVAFLKLSQCLRMWHLGAVVKLRWAATLCTQHQVSQKNTAFVGNHFLSQNCWFPTLLPSIYFADVKKIC